ncbi:hypothetical protein VEHSUH05_08540 [Veillonella denticariosi JCM 15641]|uniref:Uncharacterized protein n=1 Tax=Veillonella denticariosi JCM 15641 TaxID=1298594 RepID=A0A2S7Z7Z9_9FIRM|nr:hypothetical protein [Veillonella denticariosi]PQL19398.1 hypothetical protein VEHSUH05_08540 [Veillonella denticariosi JCM 15641]
MKVLYEERSQRAKSAELLVTFFVFLLVCAMVYTTYRSINLHTVLIAEYFIEIAAIIVMVKQAISRYTYILTDSKLIIDESSIFRKRHFEVEYDMIDGVFKFERELLTNLRYRYKYRKCSTSDPRPIWSLVYSIVNGKKVQYGRLLLKADDRFFEILSEYVDGRVRVPQEDVVFYATVRADAVKHGEDVQEYYKKLIAPEE